jgi:hypothetical protein
MPDRSTLLESLPPNLWAYYMPELFLGPVAARGNPWNGTGSGDANLDFPRRRAGSVEQLFDASAPRPPDASSALPPSSSGGSSAGLPAWLVGATAFSPQPGHAHRLAPTTSSPSAWSAVAPTPKAMPPDGSAGVISR